MAAQFVVDIITALTPDLHGALCLACSWVRDIRPMSRKTRVPTKWWPWEKGLTASVYLMAVSILISDAQIFLEYSSAYSVIWQLFVSYDRVV